MQSGYAQNQDNSGNVAGFAEEAKALDEDRQGVIAGGGLAEAFSGGNPTRAFPEKNPIKTSSEENLAGTIGGNFGGGLANEITGKNSVDVTAGENSAGMIMGGNPEMENVLGGTQPPVVSAAPPVGVAPETAGLVTTEPAMPPLSLPVDEKKAEKLEKGQENQLDKGALGEVESIFGKNKGNPSGIADGIIEARRRHIAEAMGVKGDTQG